MRHAWMVQGEIGFHECLLCQSCRSCGVVELPTLCDEVPLLLLYVQSLLSYLPFQVEHMSDLPRDVYPSIHRIALARCLLLVYYFPIL